MLYATLLCCLFGKKWGLKFTTEPAKKKKKKRLKNSERELWFMYIYTSLEKDFCVLQNYIGQRSGKLYKLIFYGIFSAAEPLSALVHWYLLNLTKVGSLFFWERVFRQMCVLWRKFFSEKFAVNSHTFTQKWQRATKESSSCVKKEPIPPDQLALCHTRVIFFWKWHQRERARRRRKKIC